jgi:hypothetical protein
VLSTDQPLALTTLAPLTSAQISGLTGPGHHLKTQTVAALTSSQLAALNADQVVALNSDQIVALSTAQVAALTTNLVQPAHHRPDLRDETRDITALTSAQLRTLSSDQLVALTTARWRCWPPPLPALRPDQWRR